MNNELKALNAFFNCIYLVTIPRSFEKRKDKIKKNLAGLQYKIFYGCDGTVLTEEARKALCDYNRAKKYLEYYSLLRYGKSYNRDLTPSELGCAMSHKMVYEDMLAHHYEKCLILEDDAVLYSPGLKKIPLMIRELPSDWGLWYLGYRWHDSESMLSRLKRKIFLFVNFLVHYKKALEEKKRHKIFYPREFKKNIWVAGFHAGTHGYAITLETAELLLKENTPICLVADMLLAHVHLNGKVKAYVSVPQVFRDDQQMTSTVLNQ